MSLSSFSATKIFQKIKDKDIPCVEVTRHFLNKITTTNDALQSFLITTEKLAITIAEKVDKKIANNEELRPLEGVPIALKDNLCLQNYPTTCSSKILQNFRPPYNATVVERLLERNMPILGKTNLDEFAMGSSTENSYFNTTRNPWSLDAAPGGSSGGSAACVAGFQSPLSLGSDTGGSIRQPAAFCGIVGFKPTYGRVSRYGLVAFASSLDQIGPFSRTVEDAAHFFNIFAGHDPKDSTSLNLKQEDFTSELDRSIKGLKVGLPKELFEKLSPEIKADYDVTIKQLEREGVIFEEMSLPTTEHALATYYIIAPAEASSNLSRFDGVRFGYRNTDADNLHDMITKSRSEGFGAEVKRRILMGSYVLSSGYYDAYYKKAQQVRTLIKADFDKAFERYDLILSPTAPTPAFKIGSISDPLEMYLSDVMTIPASMAGLPAISIPSSLHKGLPLGLQLTTNAFSEATLLGIANQFEKVLKFPMEKNPALKKEFP
jgi:aspartyl-tRNA(Asn)/glutamyl-tRNA(Gln) amidotransferase subunit A